MPARCAWAFHMLRNDSRLYSLIVFILFVPHKPRLKMTPAKMPAEKIMATKARTVAGEIVCLFCILLSFTASPHPLANQRRRVAPPSVLPNPLSSNVCDRQIYICRIV